MVLQFFGQYLLNKHLLTSDELLHAIEQQQKSKKKLGEIAVERGYLTPDEVDKIHNEQIKTDMMFGDLAVELGFITDKQLDEIIRIQKNHHKYIGETIAELGILSNEKIEEELAKFHKEQDEFKLRKKDFNFNHEYSDYLFYSIQILENLLLRIFDVKAKSGKIEPQDNNISNKYLTVEIKFEGDFNADYFLSVERSLAKLMTAKNLNISEPDDDLLMDEIGEFFNTVCGNVVALLEKNGKKCSISIPRKYREKTILFSSEMRAYRVPIITTEASIDFYMIIPDSESTESDTKKILIVDDSKSVGIKLTQIIEGMKGFRVVGQAFSGEEAITMFKTHKPDLVTMDIIMPNMNGIEAINEMHSIDPNVPVIVISSLGASQEMVFDAIKNGAKNVIVKPFETEKVQSIIAGTIK